MLEMDGHGEPVEVDDLDTGGVLDLLDQRRIDARAAELSKLRLALHWCVLHPATTESGVATVGGASLPGVLGTDESLGGPGTPAVSAFAPEPFAAVLEVSTATGTQLLADALDLAHRLPRIWSLVQTLGVEPWKARKVAQATHALSRPAAAYVDAELAPRLGSCGFSVIERVIAQAIARFHPELLAAREKRGRAGWHVTLTHPRPGDPDGDAGTSWLEVAGDTLDLSKFYAVVCDQAAALAQLGDTDELEVRKAKALGVIAEAQATLDLHTLLDTDATGDTTGGTSGVSPRRRAGKVHLYLHANLADVTTGTTGCGGTPPAGAETAETAETAVGVVEKLGPATVAKIKEWVGHTRVHITPVLDTARTWAVDAHDPPAAMVEQVILRDGHCVFPYCGTDARACDLDHIDPYLSLDEGGPPGQTSPENLAPLCRRHHRCKTSGRWRYRRQPDGTYTWTGPRGLAWTVTPFGTTRHHTN